MRFVRAPRSSFTPGIFQRWTLRRNTLKGDHFPQSASDIFSLGRLCGRRACVRTQLHGAGRSSAESGGRNRNKRSSPTGDGRLHQVAQAVVGSCGNTILKNGLQQLSRRGASNKRHSEVAYEQRRPFLRGAHVQLPNAIQKNRGNAPNARQPNPSQKSRRRHRPRDTTLPQTSFQRTDVPGPRNGDETFGPTARKLVKKSKRRAPDITGRGALQRGPGNYGAEARRFAPSVSAAPDAIATREWTVVTVSSEWKRTLVARKPPATGTQARAQGRRRAPTTDNQGVAGHWGYSGQECVAGHGQLARAIGYVLTKFATSRKTALRRVTKV